MRPVDRPWLGAGPGVCYTDSLPDQGRSPTLYAHSLPLDAAAERGVPGLLPTGEPGYERVVEL